MDAVTNTRLSEQLLLGVLACAVNDREATYVSAPITTGRRFVEWQRGDGAHLVAGTESYRREHFRNVIVPNRESVQPVVRQLRERNAGVIIDPTALEDVPGWEQFDYHSFWVQVIRRYARSVVFINGWEYSVGCTHEFVAALESDAELFKEDLTNLDPAMGIELLDKAVEDTRDGVLPTGELQVILERAYDAALRSIGLRHPEQT